MRSWDRGSRARRARAGVTGWDMGCRTLRCYANSGVGHWVSWGGNLGKCDKWEVGKRQVTSGQTRKDKRGGATLSGQKKEPLGDS